MNAYLINTQTMEWPIYEGDLRLMYPDTSFPYPLTIPPEPYAWVQDTVPPSYNVITQGRKEVTPVETDAVWYRTWEIYQLTPEQVAENEAAAREQNSNQAAAILSGTDWTATVDINNPQYSNPYLGNQDEFLAYRSSVRQIAVNPPIVVEVWPVKPEEVWVTV